MSEIPSENPNALTPRSVDARLLANVRLVHGRDTCDEAGRPLHVYLCPYHEGYEAALDVADALVIKSTVEMQPVVHPSIHDNTWTCAKCGNHVPHGNAHYCPTTTTARFR